MFAAVLLAGVAAFAVDSAAAPAKTVRYAGIHPLPPHSGEFCYIDFLHVHGQTPSDMRAYRVAGNQAHVFVGDEVALGYVGPKHGYFGPHPMMLPGGGAPLYCYLRGAHYHAQEPVPAGMYIEKEGVAWFTGNFPPEFDRDRFNIWVNDVRPIAGYQPPAVDISAAPPGYRLPATVAAVMPPPAAVGGAGPPAGKGKQPAKPPTGKSAGASKGTP